MTTNRLETDFGEDGLKAYFNGLDPTHLKPFSSHYSFSNRTWSITIWAKDWNDAKSYCSSHSLKLDGIVIGLSS